MSQTKDKYGKFPAIEIFGPTIQGEGSVCGSRSHFIRFGGCDFKCTWCDSQHAVDADKVRANARWLTTKEIVDEVVSLGSGADYVTLSGGNPCLLELGQLVMELQTWGFKVAVETQGTIYKQWLEQCDVVTVSPKPPSSGMPEKFEQLDRFCAWNASLNSSLKVVVFDWQDYEFARRIRARYPGRSMYLSVGTNPLDLASDILSRTVKISEWLLKDDMKDVRLLPQLHVLMWGHRQGV